MGQERKRIKIQAITPVHIGSGEVLQENFDYIKIKDENGSYIAPLNQKAIGTILFEKGIDISRWVAILHRRDDINDFLKKNLHDVREDKYSQRYIYLPKNQGVLASELREQIHTGMGLPYIPGSSIKGAIRTVILSDLLLENNSFKDRPDNLLIKKRDKNIEYELMQYLQVSDAIFSEGSTDALNMVNLNIRNNNSFYDESKKQLVEAITKEDDGKSFMYIKISDTELFPVASIKTLFSVINKNTERILQNDIDFWYDYKFDDNSGIVDEYINAVGDIRKEINGVEDNSCILRLGHANGWKFITGDWAKGVANDEQWEKVVKKSRPKNNMYKGYPFPKSRRINVLLDNSGHIDKVQLLGFVKLTIEE